jgi:hypothetical protein
MIAVFMRAAVVVQIRGPMHVRFPTSAKSILSGEGSQNYEYCRISRE